MGKVGNGSKPWSSWEECQVEVCSEILSLTVLPSVLARKVGSGSRRWSFSKECWAKVCSKTSLATLPLALVRKVGNSRRPWTFSKECWAKVCSETPSLTVSTACRTNDRVSKECSAKVCSKTLSLPQTYCSFSLVSRRESGQQSLPSKSLFLGSFGSFPWVLA